MNAIDVSIGQPFFKGLRNSLEAFAFRGFASMPDSVLVLFGNWNVLALRTGPRPDFRTRARGIFVCVDILIGFDDPQSSNLSVNFEDDDKVAYAYFMVDGKIDGIVWLYNHPACDRPSWMAEDTMGLPPSMPLENVSDAAFQPIGDLTEVTVAWEDYVGQREAGIFIRGVLHARLMAGDNPGLCVLAASDCPIAKPLV